MLQVDFYIIKDNSPQLALRTACRIAEKAVQEGTKTHIQAVDGDTEKLDALLWTFRDQSFVPHEIYPPSSSADCLVTIGNENNSTEIQMLINISDQFPENIKRFQRIAEIIDHQDEAIHTGRERYRLYRAQGHTPRHHEIFSTSDY